MSRWNGRFHPVGENEQPNDPSKDFPMRETFVDFAGQERVFDITLRDVQLGYLVEADEVGKGYLGYQFATFSATSPYLALGDLRVKMRRALSTRHLKQSPEGHSLPAHDTLRGRITGDRDAEGPIFVVDGVPLSLEEFGRLVQTYEGWQFSFRFVDRDAEVT